MKIRGSESGQEFFHFVILGFRSLQHELAHGNEINRDILRANTLFWKKGSLDGCRFQWYITFHVSFNLVSSAEFKPPHDHVVASVMYYIISTKTEDIWIGETERIIGSHPLARTRTYYAY